MSSGPVVTRRGTRPLSVGVCWYPEQWPEHRWAADVAGMAELGLDLVRIGEFAWSRLEPARGRFAFDWLDRVIALAEAAGLGVVLGTPTATPPVWLTDARPELCSVGPDGRPRAAGSRRHTSPSSPAAREEAARIVTALVERYGDHPAVVAWQVDNEPGNHDSARCWSPAATARFQTWLADRYGSVEALNEAWGLAFWSGEYPELGAVRLPVPTVTATSPSLRAAHLAFASDEVAAGLAAQRAIISAGSPGRPILTNQYLADVDVDPVAVARPTGLAALDLYPHGVAQPADAAFLLDLARGSALPPGAGPEHGGGRAWVTEAQVGPVIWTATNPTLPAGQVGLWAWQAVLHGVEALLWFRWRTPRAGQEQHATGLHHPDGRPTAAYAEVAAFLAALDAAPPAALARPPARIALVHSCLDAWLIDVTSHLAAGSHRALVLAAARAAWRLGEPLDVVPDDADLAGYEVILAPGLHHVRPERLARLEAALTAGATVLLGPRSLVRDGHGCWVEEPAPAGLADRLGARIAQAGADAGWPTGASRVVIDGVSHDAEGWLETWELTAADVEVVAHADGGPCDGAPVVVRRGGLTGVGTLATPVWVRLLAEVLGREPHPAHLEVHPRPGGPVVLDHATRTLQAPWLPRPWTAAGEHHAG